MDSWIALILGPAIGASAVLVVAYYSSWKTHEREYKKDLRRAYASYLAALLHDYRSQMRKYDDVDRAERALDSIVELDTRMFELTSMLDQVSRGAVINCHTAHTTRLEEENEETAQQFAVQRTIVVSRARYDCAVGFRRRRKIKHENDKIFRRLEQGEDPLSDAPAGAKANEKTS